MEKWKKRQRTLGLKLRLHVAEGGDEGSWVEGRDLESTDVIFVVSCIYKCDHALFSSKDSELL